MLVTSILYDNIYKTMESYSLISSTCHLVVVERHQQGYCEKMIKLKICPMSSYIKY